MEKKIILPRFKEADGSLSEYKIIKVLGKGAFGTCIEVQARDGLHYACKIVEKANFLTDISEFKTLKKVQHENVVTFFNAYADKVDLHAFMELCTMSLADILKDKLSVVTIKSVGRQILCGLRHIHTNNIIHRDIKPENILIDMNGVVKICDFGLSFDIDDPAPMTAIDEECGTPGYIPPEVDAGGSWCFASDIWSMGAVMLDMALGLKMRRAKKSRTIPSQISQVYSKISIASPANRPSAAQCLAYSFFRDASFINILMEQ